MNSTRTCARSLWHMDVRRCRYFVSKTESLSRIESVFNVVLQTMSLEHISMNAVANTQRDAEKALLLSNIVCISVRIEHMKT